MTTEAADVAYRRYVVARARDLPEGSSIVVDVGSRSIGVFHEGGAYYALLNRCPHKGAELCRGAVVGSLESPSPGVYEYSRAKPFLQCPWHGWEFDLATGQSYFDPKRMRVRSYAVDVETGGDVSEQIDASEVGAGHPRAETGRRRPGPYVAEVYPVAVEDDYLVVRIRD